ncbi:hypothetical protein K1T71_005024 [Dendrolimus kikuchii]|uniref:Uncharacterized protein n=1 Tax=Dendrolimus kikuchii TaxID=765133 RepID=A0ACC1D645_9NEOP|nr:hypothetical protein K1T71_005024 [Dendrolimus kikuchii]
MVYYHTSGNVKMMRNIIIDYESSNETSPYEYMKTYIEKCPETIQDAKLSWIAETFLCIQKHQQFLKAVSLDMSQELSKEDQDYFMIILHAVTFQREPKDMQLLYKCLFNISKPLLHIFTKFLSNNEVLTYISQLAQTYYDAAFITEKIISPLFQWQPYISEMAHSYAEYVKRVESRKLKLPTVPIQPNVLNRKGKEPCIHSPERSLPFTPPNSLRTKGRKMVTKSVIDQNLKHQHEKNQQKAAHLLNEVKNKDFHFAQVKSDKYYKTISNIRDEIQNKFTKMSPKPKQKFVIKTVLPSVKETAASIKRLNKHIQITEEKELQWLENVVKCCKNTVKIEEMEEFDRQERERERLIDIEKKHLMGQITHEEALIAKRKLQEENRKRYEEFMKEKEAWNEEIENWRKSEMEKNRKQVEKLSLIELNLLQAKIGVVTKKKEAAAALKKESELALTKAMKKKQEDLERKINMIKEIKILAMIAKKARVPRIIDLTETSGFGFLCEMSMVELQERLSAMKIGLHEEVERKKRLIRNENLFAKRKLENTKISIKDFMAERAIIRKHNKKSNVIINNSASKDISDLKKILQEKRKQRMDMVN